MPLIKKKTMEDYLQLMPELGHRMKFSIGPEIVQFLENESNPIDPAHIKLLIANTLPWLQTTSPRVIENGLKILITLASRLGSDFRPYLPMLIPNIVNRLSESKEYVRDKCKDFLKNLVENGIVTANYMMDYLIPALKTQKTNIREEAMKMIIIIIGRMQKLNLTPLIPHLLKLMNEVNPGIRGMAIKTLTEIYKYSGLNNEKFLNDVKKNYVGPQTKLDNLFKIFDEVPIVEVLAATRGSSFIGAVPSRVTCKIPDKSVQDLTASTSALQERAQQLKSRTLRSSQHSRNTLQPSRHTLKDLAASQQTLKGLRLSQLSLAHLENIKGMSRAQERLGTYSDFEKKISKHHKDLERLKLFLGPVVTKVMFLSRKQELRDKAKHEGTKEAGDDEVLKEDDTIIIIDSQEKKKQEQVVKPSLITIYKNIELAPLDGDDSVTCVTDTSHVDTIMKADEVSAISKSQEEIQGPFGGDDVHIMATSEQQTGGKGDEVSKISSRNA